MSTAAASVRTELAVRVLQIRYWQHLVNEGLKKNAFSVPVHMAFGHEAVATAVNSVMQVSDQLVLTHRNIAYNLARAGALRPLWDEYKFQTGGLCGGQLGSMNMTNPARGVMYSSSILGNNVSVACGLAMGQQMKQAPGVVIVLTGDGAMEEGPFYETLLFSRSQNLRLIVIIENNNFSMSSTIPERRCSINVEHLCKAVDIPYQVLRGNSVFDYRAELSRCRDHVSTAAIPAVVEAYVTNFYRHAGPTPGFPNDPMNINLNNGLILRTNDQDPVYVLKELDQETYAELEKQVLSERWSF